MAGTQEQTIARSISTALQLMANVVPSSDIVVRNPHPNLARRDEVHSEGFSKLVVVSAALCYVVDIRTVYGRNIRRLLYQARDRFLNGGTRGIKHEYAYAVGGGYQVRIWTEYIVGRPLPPDNLIEQGIRTLVNAMEEVNSQISVAGSVTVGRSDTTGICEIRAALEDLGGHLATGPGHDGLRKRRLTDAKPRDVCFYNLRDSNMFNSGHQPQKRGDEDCISNGDAGDLGKQGCCEAVTYCGNKNTCRAAGPGSGNVCA